MKRIGFALGALAVLIFAVLAQWPAGHALRLAGSGGALEAAGYRGTVWRGEALDARWRGVRLGDLSWRLRPLSLLAMRPRARVVLEGAELSGSGRIEATGGGDLRLSDLRISAPAGWVEPALGQPFLRLGGELEADLGLLAFEDGWLTTAEGRTRWVGASVLGRIDATIGELVVDWATSEGVIAGRLSDTGGPLSADGLITVRDRSWRLEATLSAPEDAVALRQALAVIGRPTASGTVRLSLSGPMVPLR